ncbi:MAG: hypothetical protein GX299_01530 [Epulopiscium sp.]|nr:hypothetical protein [Candidatus Epulonipiscium sp.]
MWYELRCGNCGGASGVVTAGAGMCCGDVCARLSHLLKYRYGAVFDASDRDK